VDLNPIKESQYFRGGIKETTAAAACHGIQLQCTYILTRKSLRNHRITLLAADIDPESTLREEIRKQMAVIVMGRFNSHICHNANANADPNVLL
jgi:hypothetical protein